MEQDVAWRNVIALAAAVGAVIGAVINGAFQFSLRWWDRRTHREDVDRDRGTGQKMADVGNLYGRLMQALRSPDRSGDWPKLVGDADHLVALAVAVGMPSEFVLGAQTLRKITASWESRWEEVRASGQDLTPVDRRRGGSYSEAICQEVIKRAPWLKEFVKWVERLDVPMRAVYEAEDRRLHWGRRHNKRTRRVFRDNLRDITKLVNEFEAITDRLEDQPDVSSPEKGA